MGLSLEDLDRVNAELRKEVEAEHVYDDKPPPEWLIQTKIKNRKPRWLRQAEAQARGLRREREELGRRGSGPDAEDLQIRVHE
jgi:hypothetical protein